MTLHRRALLAAAPSLLAAPALAAPEPPPTLAAYERDTGGRAGLFARNLATGRTIAWRADERFVMCSSFKASLVGLVLARVDRGEEQLDRRVSFGQADLLGYAPVSKQHLADGHMSIEEMCAGAVELSDNTCANLLLAAVGGPAAMTAFWRRLGDPLTRLDHNEPELNRSPPGDPHDTTTPAAMAGDMRKLLLADALSPVSRGRLTGWMVNCQTGDNRLRGGLPKAWRIADKTGNNGADAAGDLALAWPTPKSPIVITAYVQGGAPTPDQLTAHFADIGRLVADRLA